MCAESHWGLSANYRLKSDREKSEGKGTAAGSCGRRREEEKGGGGVFDFSLNPPTPSLSRKTKFNHLGVLLAPLSPLNPTLSLVLPDRRSGVNPRWDQSWFHGTSHLSPELMLFSRGSLGSARARSWDLPSVKVVRSASIVSHTHI